MSYDELLILLPCHSFEDFPVHHTGSDAHDLLECWIGPWHPRLIADAGKMPKWHRNDQELSSSNGRLIVVPSVSEPDLAEATVALNDDDECCLIRGASGRQMIHEQALAKLPPADSVDPDLVADFSSLGYCYLQIELLTRQMSYSSMLEEESFEEHLVSAARHAVENRPNESKEKLSRCFDMLAEERDHYYPVDAYLIDLTLIAPTTLGASLRQSLAGIPRSNLLMPVSTLQGMASQHPESLELLRSAVSDGRACPISGPMRELPDSLIDCETILASLRNGMAEFHSVVGAPLEVFGRFHHGLTPILPQLIDKLKLKGAIHATLDGGPVPHSSQAKTRWEGIDGTAVPALARTPLDATKSETFLALAKRLGESMESDYLAAICLAHWAGQSSPWYEDIQRCDRYNSVMGKLTTLADFFDQSDHMGHFDRFEPDQYKSHRLVHAVSHGQADPVSRYMRFWRLDRTANSVQALSAFSRLLSPVSCGADHGQLLDRVRQRMAESLDFQMDDETSASILVDSQAELRTSLDQVMDRFLKVISNKPTETPVGIMAVNPDSFTRRVVVSLDADIEDHSAIYAVGPVKDRLEAIVDVPACGYVFLKSSTGAGKNRGDGVPLAEENVLRNEFFEATVDPQTGGLRSVYDFRHRGNRISQQLAFRFDKRVDDPRLAYTSMQCDRQTISINGPIHAEVRTEGKLLDTDENVIADYCQSYRIWRGIRVLHITSRLEPRRQPEGDPWRSYYASRFAWSDEATEMSRGVLGVSLPTDATRLEAPLYLEMAGDKHRTSLLTGGIPFHRKVGSRMLDSLLIVPGETCREFHMGIGVDLKQPLHDALGFLSEPMAMPSSPPIAESMGWLFHVNVKHVMATHWMPVFDDEEPETVVGVRVRLLETSGRTGRVSLSGYKEFLAARELDFWGQHICDCQVEEGNVRLEMNPYQWSEIEAKWRQDDRDH